MNLAMFHCVFWKTKYKHPGVFLPGLHVLETSNYSSLKVVVHNSGLTQIGCQCIMLGYYHGGSHLANNNYNKMMQIIEGGESLLTVTLVPSETTPLTNTGITLIPRLIPNFSTLHAKKREGLVSELT